MPEVYLDLRGTHTIKLFLQFLQRTITSAGFKIRTCIYLRTDHPHRSSIRIEYFRCKIYFFLENFYLIRNTLFDV